jgi:PAS domain-containing protein
MCRRIRATPRKGNHHGKCVIEPDHGESPDTASTSSTGPAIAARVTSTPLSPSGNASEEISVLIRTLRETDQRLDELTAGQIDTVADRDGRSFLLHHAQSELRYADAAKQAAILNALPAHIILVDAQGLIISVNDAWHQLAHRTAMRHEETAPSTLIGSLRESARFWRGLCPAIPSNIPVNRLRNRCGFC